MQAGEQINWGEFCALRTEVRRCVEANTECPAEVTKRWQDARNAIVSKYFYLVNKVADSRAKKIKEVDRDELASYGIDGLYDAVDGFEPELGIKFQTYASYRIKGAMTDLIRRYDWVPRLVRSRAKKLAEVQESLSTKLGRLPNDEEMAAAMEMTKEEYEGLLKSSSLRSMQSLDVSYPGNDGDGGGDGSSVVANLRDASSHEPIEQMISDELKSKLFGKGFNKQEKALIDGYYFESRSMKEVADSINLSESRISQMNTRIISLLRDKILRNPEYFGKNVVDLVQRMEREDKAKKAAKPSKRRRTACQ